MKVEKRDFHGNTGQQQALVVLRPESSRALIGRAIASLERVQERTRSGRMVIVGGSTTRHVAHALTGEDPGCATFAVGWIRDGLLGETPRKQRGAGPFLFEDGHLSRGWPGPLLERFSSGDIYIKGANAIDSEGYASVLMGSPTGGTIGAAFTILMARGGELIVPVSLQKLIPSVQKTCGLFSQDSLDDKYVMGAPVGVMPLSPGTATIMTEVTAMHLLFHVTATPVAAGGLADCAGAVVLHLRGKAADVDTAWRYVTTLDAIKSETDKTE